MVSRKARQITFSEKDQRWLVTLEKTILPIIGDFHLTLDKVAAAMQVSQTQLNRKVK